MLVCYHTSGERLILYSYDVYLLIIISSQIYDQDTRCSHAIMPVLMHVYSLLLEKVRH